MVTGSVWGQPNRRASFQEIGRPPVRVCIPMYGNLLSLGILWYDIGKEDTEYVVNQLHSTESCWKFRLQKRDLRVCANGWRCETVDSGVAGSKFQSVYIYIYIYTLRVCVLQVHVRRTLAISRGLGAGFLCQFFVGVCWFSFSAKIQICHQIIHLKRLPLYSHPEVFTEGSNYYY